MTGQEAVNVAEAFNDAVGLDGVILTKIDGDARGGAALSVKEVVGKPILFVGTGEKLDEFEPFHPDRMASRILGMGDVLTLIEKVEATFDEDEKRKAEEMLQSGELTLEDFLEQMQQIKRMGPLQNVLGMLPGMPKEVRNAEIDDKRARPHRGDHPLDDARGAAQARAHQRLAPHAHRAGQRHDHERDQQPAEAVQAGAADDEGHARRGPQGEGRQEGQGQGKARARRCRRISRRRPARCAAAGFPGIDPDGGLPGFPPR